MPRADAAFELPIHEDTVILDRNIHSALERQRAERQPPYRPSSLEANEQAWFNDSANRSLVDLRSPTLDYRTGPTVIAEANVHRVSPVADISFSRTHGPGDPEYDLLLAKLKFYGVGKSSGAKDQHMVADVFFAQTPPGVVPKFVTADGPVANGLARASGNPRVDMTQPFTVTIDGREIVVLYLQ